MNKDVIIIGAGVAGAVAARKLAEQGNKILIIEKRNHIGGNCYDEKDAAGILIHTYGPHIFHTEDEDVFEFFDRFTDWYWYPQGHKVVAKVGDSLIPVPFNLNTLRMIYDEKKASELEIKLKDAYGDGARVPILKLRESEDADIRAIADFVYENIFLHYTMKQWGQTPDEIDPAVTGRVPINISTDDRYFKDKYQGVPLEGFTTLFENMLKHENIEVITGVDCRDVIKLDFASNQVLINCSKIDTTGKSNNEMELFTGQLIYTGAIDELLDCKYGRLPYRSLRFDFEHLDKNDFQDGHSVVNYTVSEDFTRITEFKYLTGQKDAVGTTIVREYPFAYTGAKGEIPYYAIINDDNNALYEKYKNDLNGFNNLHLLGRLAEYRYYNIDVMAAKAIELAEKIH